MHASRWRRSLSLLVAIHGLVACTPGPKDGSASVQAAAVTASQAASTPAPVASSRAVRADEPWQPDEQQRAVLASLPQDVAEQQRELIRLAQIPTPSYEERVRFLDLMGSGPINFPRDHPLRKNKEYLLAYYRGLPAPSQQELDELVASLKQRMIFVKGGRFIMGDFGPLKFKDKLQITADTNNPAHPVELDSYSIMKGRVTYGEFDLYQRASGRKVLAEGNSVAVYRRRPGYMAWPIKWADADGYCRWLADLTGQPFALPSEAQWEYAAREGGKFIAYPVYGLPGVVWGNQFVPTLQSMNSITRALEAKAGRTTFYISPEPPGLTGENRIGMQDVLGATEEWVGDWYAEDYYKVSPLRNPRGPESGTHRVMRYSAAGWTRSVLSRDPQSPDEGMWFRCALSLPKPWR